MLDLSEGASLFILPERVILGFLFSLSQTPDPAYYW